MVHPALLPLMRTPRLPVLFTLPRNMVHRALLPLMRTPRLLVVEWTDAPADLNGFVRFAERRNLVSARVPSHFKHSLRATYVRRDTKQHVSFSKKVIYETEPTNGHLIRGYPPHYGCDGCPSIYMSWNTMPLAGSSAVWPFETARKGVRIKLQDNGGFNVDGL